MMDAQEYVFKLTADIQNFTQTFQKWTATLTDATNHLEQLSETHDAQAAAVARSWEEVSRLAKAYEEAKEKLEEANAAIAAGNGVSDGSWNILKSDVTNAKAALEGARATLLDNRAALQSNENAISTIFGGLFDWLFTKDELKEAKIHRLMSVLEK